ncbi:AbrB/MazE/SpoVT family DNA-binding domain-containing protein [Spongisporangium articulatum]|uniref:AbrB/MazE/SpoVT family DNA-binding domain-containing protein n=1 Tax=Spongisporangium articulatum TaxID=3362603 RepID=A0ABW8APV6_9ACTN
MSWATVTSKGQVTIPADVRKKLGLKRGSRVNFVEREDGVIEIVPVTRSIMSLRGILPAPAEPVTLAQMEEGIAEGAVYGESGLDAE